MTESPKRKRTALINNFLPFAVLCSDLHIRPDTPACRKDDYGKAQESKIDFILDLCKKYDCKMLVSGDFGHKSLNDGWPTELLRWAIDKFKEVRPVVIPGQHDLPSHRIENIKKSGIGVLHAAGAIQIINEPTSFLSGSGHEFVIFPFPYGMPMEAPQEPVRCPLIAMTHQMVINKKTLWPGQEGFEYGNQLLKKFKSFDVILSGDNHQSFDNELDGRFLVNPGSMMRMTLDQKEHEPAVYLWDGTNKKIQRVLLPIEADVIDERYEEKNLQSELQRKRLESFISKVRQDVEIELSFEDNLKKYFKKHRTEQDVQQLIWDFVA